MGSRIFANGTCNKRLSRSSDDFINSFRIFGTLASNEKKKTRMGSPGRRAKNNVMSY